MIKIVTLFTEETNKSKNSKNLVLTNGSIWETVESCCED